MRVIRDIIISKPLIYYLSSMGYCRSTVLVTLSLHQLHCYSFLIEVYGNLYKKYYDRVMFYEITQNLT